MSDGGALNKVVGAVAGRWVPRGPVELHLRLLHVLSNDAVEDRRDQAGARSRLPRRDAALATSPRRPVFTELDASLGVALTTFETQQTVQKIQRRQTRHRCSSLQLRYFVQCATSRHRLGYARQQVRRRAWDRYADIRLRVGRGGARWLCRWRQSARLARDWEACLRFSDVDHVYCIRLSEVLYLAATMYWRIIAADGTGEEIERFCLSCARCVRSCTAGGSLLSRGETFRAIRMAQSKPKLTEALLRSEARGFAERESTHSEPSLFGVTDGKAVGTYLEQKFRHYIAERYTFEEGNSAKGIDFPDIDVDIKVTSEKQPQSSCPFKSARQKIFGLGYSLLVFVYDKSDDPETKTATLRIVHTIFVESAATGDFTMTKRLREMLDDGGNEDDVVAYLTDRNLPVDEIEGRNIARDVLKAPPSLGYLTISNALQWRLQYGHAIREAGRVSGVVRL